MKVLISCKLDLSNLKDKTAEIDDWCDIEFGPSRWKYVDDDIEFYNKDDVNLFLIHWDSTIVDAVYEDRYTADKMADTLFEFGHINKFRQSNKLR